MRYYSIYVENTVDFFTYSSVQEIKIGTQVKVSFQNKKRVGVVIEEEIGKSYNYNVLEIEEILDNEISFSKSYIKMLLWIKEYYMVGFDQIYTTAIPKGLKIKYVDKYVINFKSSELSKEDSSILSYMLQKQWVTKATLNKIFGKEKVKEYLKDIFLVEKDKKYTINRELDLPIELERYFLERSEFSRDSIEKRFDKKEIETLLKEERIFLIRRLKEKDTQELTYDVKDKSIRTPTVLNDEQERIKQKIIDSKKRYFLLRGVTGSGKTEIYIHLIRDGLEKGKGAIFLVPEISLTPQMVKRFKDEFGDEVAILHSRLSNLERAREWYNIYSGQKRIILGVRSAIFAPVKNLGYIIIDEEHENSYKQDTSPRYHAKYVALKRAELEGAKVVLGSATPSIESYYYAKKGLFELLELENRYRSAKLPEIKIVDMKREQNNFFSELLLKKIRDRLLKKEQVILLLNRKGYSTVIQCKKCGFIEECEHCSISLSYYAGVNRLKCNYCGIGKLFSGSCSNCGSNELEFGGQGVERIEEELKKIFPVNIIRVDGEVAKEKDLYERMYFDFLNKKYDIMIGTQMISRGLHFPDVTLVGVINADTLMGIPDFRTGERTYQLITQVAGRAGRGEKSGEVIIQTYQPENHVIEKIQENSYVSFYEKEIKKREELFYPPFSRIINIGISSSEEKGLEEFAIEFHKRIKDEEIEIYGPMRAMVYRVKGRYRYNIFVKGEREKINNYKERLLKAYKEMKNRKYRVVIDVEPTNLI